MGTATPLLDRTRHLAAWLDTRSGLGALFIVGLAIRIVLARGGGFPFDMSSFAAWAGTLADKGPWNFYPLAGEFFVDYPPGYLYVLWVLGLISDALLGGAPSVLFLKLPPILADLGLAWAVSVAAERLTPAIVVKRLPVRALAAAAILLNPPVFFVSAVWGQADSVLALLVVAAFILLGTGAPTFRHEAGGVALLAVALGTKPQVVFVFPIVALLLAWRHLYLPLAGADDPSVRSRALLTGARRMIELGAIAVATGFLLFLPFRLYPARALDFYLHASRTYRVTSVFAFNLWGAVGFWKPDSGRAEGVVRFLGVPAVAWGIALFVVLAAAVCVLAWRALRAGVDEGRVLFFGGAATALVAFAIVTRIHERYLFLPLTMLAVLIGIRWIRRGFVVLSVLYLVNVYFPYVYYLRYVKRPAPSLGGFFDAFYGPDIYGARMRVLCVVVGVACLGLAWRGWRAVEAEPEEVAEPPPPTDDVAAPEHVPAGPAGRRRWTFALHPVGRRGAALALGVFAIALASRLAGLGHPPGMYFDEVYHARAGAEYIGDKEIFEYTHPPLAKQLMGFATEHLSGFNARRGPALPETVAPATVVAGPQSVFWAINVRRSTLVQQAVIDDRCRARPGPDVTSLPSLHADALAITPTSAYIAGTSDGTSALVRMQGATEMWRTTLPAAARSLAVVKDRSYVVTREGELVTVSSEGDPETLAVGADALSAFSDETKVWVSFPKDERIAAYDADGARGATIETGGETGPIVAHRASQRVYVSVGDDIVGYDTERNTEHARIKGAAGHLETVPETSLIWAVEGIDVRIIEPLSGVVIGGVRLDSVPDRLSSDPVRHRLLGISGDALQCAGGRAQFAWRLGSAVTGSLMVAFVFLIALRLFGNTLIAGLAALFLAIDGLAFTLSRIAMNDSYAGAGLLAAWFCVLSAAYAWGRKVRPDDADDTDDTDEAGGGGDAGRDDQPRERSRAILWLAATGVAGAFGLSSKWPVLYGLAAIGLFVLWDGLDRGPRSLWTVAGPFAASAAVIVVSLVVVPVGLYMLTYIPYMSLGHSFVDVLRLQRGMFDYHATLKATHPYGSQWYGWPFGYRAVYLYVHNTAGGRAEMWTFPNLVVFWGGLVGLAAAGRRALQTRTVVPALIVIAALVQYLPWVAVSRVAFMYHYLPVVPFLAVALAWYLVDGLKGRPYRPAVLQGTVALAIAFFAFSYPILVGWDMPTGYFDLTRIFSWVIP